MSTSSSQAAPTALASELEQYARATLNILEDSASEKAHLEDTQRAVLNVLEDFAGDRVWFQEVQRAVLNILEDFDRERARAEAANQELRVAFESLRRAKEAADAANRELEAFSYSVSHDLRAPLRAMDGFSLSLLDDYGDKLDDQAQDFLHRIRRASQGMAGLIDDLLNLSRISRAELNREQVNLSEIARAVAAGLKEAQPERPVSFIIAERAIAEGDPQLLRQVLHNLLENAWKFTSKHEHATIEFGLTRQRGEVVYFVRDDGAGFDMTYADKLFGVFQRLHSTIEFEGTGVGLALVHRIVRRHGGRVWAEGELEKGATFYFTL